MSWSCTASKYGPGPPIATAHEREHEHILFHVTKELTS